MIYLVAFQQDLVFSFVRQHLLKHEELRERITLIPFEKLTSIEFDYDHFHCSKIKTSSAFFSLFENDKIYLRPYSFTEAANLEVLTLGETARFGRLYQELLMSRQTILGNTSLRSESNNDKFRHPFLFDDILRSPTSSLTNHHAHSKMPSELSADGENDLVVKSPSFVRTEVVSFKNFNRELDRDAFPTVVLQHRVRGMPLRITVVGFENIVAAEIRGPVSDHVDYRYADHDKTEIRSVDLSEDIRERSIEIAKRYGLPLCGIDVIRDGDHWHFLEVNPEPGWAYLEREDNVRIFDFILRYLELATPGLFPDDSLTYAPRFETHIELLDHPQSTRFPSALKPTDFVARPNEEHPFWRAR